MLVDLLNDFGADMNSIGHPESNEDDMEIGILNTDWEWYGTLNNKIDKI